MFNVNIRLRFVYGSQKFEGIPGWPMREAALIRGVIIKAISSSLILFLFIRRVEKSFDKPGRLFFLKTRKAEISQNSIFSDKGTISESVASPTKSNNHFSCPSLTLIFPSFHLSIFNIPCINFPNHSRSAKYFLGIFGIFPFWIYHRKSLRQFFIGLMMIGYYYINPNLICVFNRFMISYPTIYRY